MIKKFLCLLIRVSLASAVSFLLFSYESSAECGGEERSSIHTVHQATESEFQGFWFCRQASVASSANRGSHYSDRYCTSYIQGAERFTTTPLFTGISLTVSRSQVSSEARYSAKARGMWLNKIHKHTEGWSVLATVRSLLLRGCRQRNCLRTKYNCILSLAIDIVVSFRDW